MSDQAPSLAPSAAPSTVAEGDETVVVAWSSVWVTTIVSMGLGFILLTWFLIVRGRHAKKNNFDVYETRQYKYSNRSAAPFDNKGKGCFGWARAVLFGITEDELLRCVGLDMYMFLRFLRLFFKCSLMGTLLGGLILIPIYATGEKTGNDTEEFNSITLAHVEEGSARLWAAAVCWLLFVVFVLRELYLEWKLTYAPKRYEFLAHGDIDTEQEYRYAVLIENVPKSLRSNAALRNHLDKIFPSQIHQVHVCLNTEYLDALVDQRLSNLKRLEQAILYKRVNPDKPAPKVRPGSNVLGCGGKGDKVDAIPYFQGEVDRLNQEIDARRQAIYDFADSGFKSNSSETHENADASKQEKGDDKGDDVFEAVVEDVKKGEGEQPAPQPPATSDQDVPLKDDMATSTAFVTFTSLKAKQTAVQCNIGGKADYMDIEPAPEPNAVVWNNITVPLPIQEHTSKVAGAIWLVGILFWSVPVTFVTGLANLNSLLETLGIEQLNPDTFWYGLISGLLPVLLIQGLMFCIYMAIGASAKFFIRKKSLPDVEYYAFSWYMLYQFANLWLILIGGSAINQLNAMIKDPSSIVKLMASAVPGASIFFLNMTILGAFVMSMFYLANISGYSQKLALNIVFPKATQTQRMKEDLRTPQPLLYGMYLPPMVFIVLVAFVYMPIVPLMMPFAAAYFGIMYVSWKHNCLHVFANESEGGGVIWEKLFGFIMACLYIAEFIVIAYLSIKEGVGPAIFCVVPAVATIIVHKRLGRNIIGPIQSLSLEVAAEIDLQDGELSKEEGVEESYVEAVEQQLYGQPNLKHSMDERGPRPEEGVVIGGNEAEHQKGDEEVGIGATGTSDTPEEGDVVGGNDDQHQKEDEEAGGGATSGAPETE